MAEQQNELSEENDISILEDSPSVGTGHPSAVPPSSHLPEFQIYSSPQPSLASSQFALQTAYNDLKTRYNQLDGKHKQLLRAVRDGRVAMATRNIDFAAEDTAAPRSRSPVANGEPESVGSDVASAQFRSLEMRSKFLENELYKLQAEKRRKQQEVDRLSDKLKRLEADNGRLINENQSIKDKIQTMITRHRMEIGELQEKMSVILEEKEASKTRLGSLDAVLKTKERELASFKKHCLQLDRELKETLKDQAREKQVYMERLSTLQGSDNAASGVIGEKELLALKFQIEAVKKDNENLKKIVQEQKAGLKNAIQREKTKVAHSKEASAKPRSSSLNEDTTEEAALPRESSPRARRARDVMTESCAIPCSEDIMQDELGTDPGQDLTYATMIPASGPRSPSNLSPDGHFSSIPSITGEDRPLGHLDDLEREQESPEVEHTADPDEGLGRDSLSSDQGQIFASAISDVQAVSPRNLSQRSRGSMPSNQPLSGAAGNNMAASTFGASVSNNNNNQRSPGLSGRNAAALNFERNEDNPKTRDNSRQNVNLYKEEEGGSKLGSANGSPTVLNNDPLLGHKVGMIPSKNLLSNERSQPEGATIHIPLRDNMDEYDRICPSCNRVFPVSMPMEELQQHVMDCMPGESAGVVHNSLEEEVINNAEERVCPMCSAVFPRLLPQSEFESHVNGHFADEMSMVSQFEVLSGNS